MSNSNRLTTSNREREYTLGNKVPLISRVNNFLYASHNQYADPEKLIFLAEEIGKFGGAESQLLHASARVEIAQKFASEFGHKSIELLSEAGVQAAGLLKPYTAGSIAIKAETLVKEIPLRVSIVEGKQPPVDLVEKLHLSRLESIPRIFEIWSKAKSSLDVQERRNVKGVLSETAVQLMLNRYGIYEIGSGWLPISSSLSEDRGHKWGDETRDGWDISVLSKTSSSDVDLTNKLQVKTSSVDDKVYAYGVDVIYVDMIETKNPSFSGVQPQYILNELYDEFENGTERTTERLDQRTEVLLDMFC